LNILSGGALEQLSIVMLGFGPFITSTIILQLMTMVFPKLKEMYQEEGEQGRQKFNQYGRMLTVPFAALQGFGFITLLTRQNVIDPLGGFELITTLITITAGAVFLMWLGELISEKGIGNGISLMIFAGIVASVPLSIRQLIVTFTADQLPTIIIFFVLAIVIIAGVVMVNEARRNVSVSYAKRVRGGRVYGGVSTFLPLNLNPAGVIPIIFALSIMLFPGMIANFMSGSTALWAIKIANLFNAFSSNAWVYGFFYFFLVVRCPHFLSFPDDISNYPQTKNLYFIMYRMLLGQAPLRKYIIIP